MGRLPAYGFFVRHADRVRLRNVECIADKPDARPAIVCDDVDDIIFAGLELTAPAGAAPLFDLRNTRRVFLTGMRSPAGKHCVCADLRRRFNRYRAVRKLSGTPSASGHVYRRSNRTVM